MTYELKSIRTELLNYSKYLLSYGTVLLTQKSMFPRDCDTFKSTSDYIFDKLFFQSNVKFFVIRAQRWDSFRQLRMKNKSDLFETRSTVAWLHGLSSKPTSIYTHFSVCMHPTVEPTIFFFVYAIFPFLAIKTGRVNAFFSLCNKQSNFTTIIGKWIKTKLRRIDTEVG